MNKTSQLVSLVVSTIIANSSLAFAGDCVYSLYGKCYDCNTKYALKVGSQDNCEAKCPNRVYVFKDRTCRLKIGETVAFPTFKDSSVSKSKCTLDKGEENKATKNTVETYFIGSNGKCYPCKTEEPVQISADDCSKKRFCNQNCSQRIRKNYSDASILYSVLKCPSNRPLMDRYMMCWSCDEETPIDMSFSQNLHSVCKKQRSMNNNQIPFSYFKK